MKKVLTVLAIFMSMLCSSIILVSCSNDYKKMYLVVEYALPTEDGQNVEWKQIESNGNFDYTLSQGVYSNEDSAYVLYLRVMVKGISKKVDSLYISQSANNATILDGNTVKPDEAFKVLVKNIGSVTFNVIPSNGGEDKAVSFGVNIYRELTDIKQSTDCVPALVTGGYVRLESLNNLIKYYPYDDVAKETLTNQTGVDYSIESIGTLVNNGGDNLIDRTFVLNEEFESTGLLAENKNNKNQYVQLSNASGHLMLNVSTGYKLTNSNNVIKLLATSKYNPEIKTSVYVYIVENFTSTSLLVSYSDSVLLDNTGNLPTQTEISQPISDTATIYNSLIDNDTYNYIKLYTYTNASIYSYESNPGIKLSVYVNGVNYNYNDVVDNTLGIQISPVHKDVNGESKLIGLKFEVNPNANSTINTYNIRLELDFTAFDFSASDKTPVSVLNKEFTINVESLASGFHINGKGYSDNLDALLNGQESTITEYNSTQPAKLYTHYTQSAIGLPLNIQATPTNAVDTKVYVSFYEDYKFESGQLVLENNLATKVQLLESSSFGLPSTNGEYQIDFANKNKLVYLKLNEKEDISALQKIYMVCKVVCTPESFGLNTVEQKYITFVAKIDVVGSVNNIYVYKQSSDNVANNTLTDTYLANNTENVAYINLNSTSNNVNLSEITITSTNGNIKYSADRVNWVESITAENLNTIMGGTYKTLYFRTVKECDDSIIISSPNGIKNQLDYTFVNVTSSADNVKLEYDSPYVWESQTIDKVGISDVTDAENVDLKYLALQSGATVQFKAYGDNRNANIKSVTATSLMQSNAMYSKITKGGNSVYNSMTSFSDSAIKVLNSPSYLFDVQANSVGFTAVMLVEVKFYVNVLNADGVTGSADDSVYTIVERSKYFVYEVAVYTPAKDLEVTTDKDLIVYVNEHYLSSAKVEFEVALNKATQRIQFSSNAVNESINLSYGETGEASIYGISVTTNATMTDGSGNPYFQINDLNRYQYEIGGQIKNEYFVKNTTRKFSIQALQGLSGLGQDSIYVDITIYQFGTQTIYQIRKVIYFGDYEKADGIVVDGVDNYNNLYLSLLSGNTVRTTIYASVSNQSATYKDLGYNIFLLDEDTNLLIDYRGSNLSITHNPEDDSFEINATNKGGIYQLELFAKDSYDAEINDYKVKFNIRITVSDGKTETTAYLISSLSEFETIATNSQNYYRLAKDIDISALSKTNWWDKERQFAGFLDGAITINDPNTGNVIYKCYSLIGLKISEYKTVSDVTCFGLFNSVTGTIKNITFDRVTFDVALNNENTSSNNPVNIGAVTAINNGTIENCSVNIVASEVVIKSYIENADGSTTDISAENTNYNIGLIAGINNKTISYNNTNLGSNYAYMTDCYSAGKLTVTVQAGNSKFTNSTNLNVGAVVGQNGEKGTISATYEDGSTQSIRTLISAVSNIEVLVDYDESHAPMTINSALGGIAGLNAGTITKVAVSGRLVANDKVNLGGIAGVNTGKVQECTNYGAYIEGRILNEDYTYTYAGGITKSNIYHSFTDDGTSIDLEQNIGGIIGFNNAGIVDNTRTMFIVFDSNEVSIEASRAQIVGVGNVGGVIGKATNTQLTRAYVENFVSDGENELNYNIIGVNANVAGLVAYSANSSANLSFVQADFNVGDSIFYEFGKNLDFKYVYFIGDVLSNNIENNELKEHNIATIYSYIVNTVIYLDAEGKIAIQANEYGVDDITLNSDFEIAGFTASWRKSEQESINNKYPYLVYTVDSKDVYTLTIRPSEIIVNVDENYFDSDAVEDDTVKFERYETTEGDSQDGLYIQYKNNDQVSATAVVYYVANGNNTHKLVSEDTDKGLIEKAILPSISSGVYSVNIISGAQIASLTDGDATITFYGVGKVVLKFASLYDTKVQDTVTIFVENPLHQDTFTLTTGTGLEDRNGQGERFTTRVGVNSLINVGLKDVNGQTFDATKTYMSAKVDNANIKVNGVTTEIADDKLSEYFTFAPKTKEIVAGSGKYVLGQFEMSAIKLDSSYSYLEIPITISVYLNLNKYLINDVALDTLMENTEALLEQRTITIIIYNKATNLTVSSDVKVESGVGVNINAELITGYINTSIESGNPSYTVSGTNGNKLLLEVAGQDKIDLTLTAVNDNAKDLLKVAKNNASNPQEFGVWDLFETIVTYTKLDDNSGYDYNINLKLKKEYRYLDLKDYMDGEWRFELEISANSNSELKKTVDVWFVPQQLTSFRLENYSNLVSRAGEVNGTTESEFKSNEAESSLIIPGESGLIKIFAEYDYSYFENISITSTTQVIDGKEYFIRYQQMVYNKEKGVYQSYAGITADGETLNLKKISYSDGSYDGIIFVRTILENIVGVRKTFTITVNATTYDSEGNSINVSRSKTVISQYRPGVYISVDNALSTQHDSEQVYLVEQNSSVTNIVARVYGYEFNVQPLITISPVNGGDVIAGDVTLIKQGDIYKDNTGAYVITYSLAVYTDKPFAVSMKMTLIENGNELSETSKTLTFYPVPYILNDVYLKGEANGGLNI
ncbi:MAG: hypothetical protein IJ358_02940, partial [Clostridia bacterium]|nr:hypothetical protein [Clostridia bacterium]